MVGCGDSKGTSDWVLPRARVRVSNPTAVKEMRWNVLDAEMRT